MWKKIKKAIKKIVQAVRSVVTQVVTIVKEVINRVLGLPDFLASLLGIRFWKKLRVAVVILREETGKPVIDPKEAEAAISEAAQIFRKFRVKMVPANQKYVTTVATRSPSAALVVHCNGGSWREDLGEAGSYFRDYSANNVGGFAIGYGAPITVFVVRDVIGKWGCHLGFGWLTNYVTVDREGITSTPFRIIAHEIGHACGLWHRKAASNLMKPSDFGEDLMRWQQAIFRDSRHVTFL